MNEKDLEKANEQHKQYKEDIVFMMNLIGEEFMNTAQLITLHSYSQLTKYQSADNFKTWEQKQNKYLKSYFKEIEQITKEKFKDINQTVKDVAKEVDLDKYQKAKINKILQEGYQECLNNALQQHKESIHQIAQQENVLTNNVGNVLSQAITTHLEQNVDNGIVEYRDGKKFRWENYMEMKVRTEFTKDLVNNLFETGKENGVVFYIASYFGDCAEDHVELNGAICYDEDYTSFGLPKAEQDEIEDYIKAHKLMSIQQAVGADGNYFTVRPNCRHIFQYIATEQVIAFKSEKEISEYRDEQGLNFNGKYKPEKYDALKEQRRLERQIRKFSERVEMARDDLSKLPQNASVEQINKLKNYIAKNEQMLNQNKKEFNEHLNKNKFLAKNTRRLQPGKMMSDLGHERRSRK